MKYCFQLVTHYTLEFRKVLFKLLFSSSYIMEYNIFATHVTLINPLQTPIKITKNDLYAMHLFCKFKCL